MIDFWKLHISQLSLSCTWQYDQLQVFGQYFAVLAVETSHGTEISTFQEVPHVQSIYSSSTSKNRAVNYQKLVSDSCVFCFICQFRDTKTVCCKARGSNWPDQSTWRGLNQHPRLYCCRANNPYPPYPILAEMDGVNRENHAKLEVYFWAYHCHIIPWNPRSNGIP